MFSAGLVVALRGGSGSLLAVLAGSGHRDPAGESSPQSYICASLNCCLTCKLLLASCTIQALFDRMVTSSSRCCPQDLTRMRMDELQPFMLPWDVRHLSACCCCLAPQLADLGTLEPSLLPTPGSHAHEVWPAGHSQLQHVAFMFGGSMC